MDFQFVYAGRPWSVQFVDKKSDGLKKAYGLTDYKTGTILVRNDLNPHMRLITVWHEIAHIFFEPQVATASDHLHVELACDWVGHGMLQMLQVKHLLPKWLFEPATPKPTKKSPVSKKSLPKRRK